MRPTHTMQSNLLYSQSTSLNVNLTPSNSLAGTPRIRFDEISWHRSPAKLLRKINHHTLEIQSTQFPPPHFPDSWATNSCSSHLSYPFSLPWALWSLLSEDPLPECLSWNLLRVFPVTICHSPGGPSPPAWAPSKCWPHFRPPISHHPRPLPPWCLSPSKEIRVNARKNNREQETAKTALNIF